MTPKAEDGIIESIRVLRGLYLGTGFSRPCRPPDTRPADHGSRGSQGPSAHSAPPIEWRVCARFRLDGDTAEPLEGTKLALRTLARRYEVLTKEMSELEAALDELTARANPALRGAKGVRGGRHFLVAAGYNPGRIRTEAAFVAMCGVNPIEASSGKIVRHRLNRSGNRQANHALWRIVMVRMTNDETTKKYIARRKAEGRTQREAIRCLKRYVAREVYRLVVDPQAVPSGTALRDPRSSGTQPPASFPPPRGLTDPGLSSRARTCSRHRTGHALRSLAVPINPQPGPAA